MQGDDPIIILNPSSLTNAKIAPGINGMTVYAKDGSVLASGFSGEEDANLYVKSILSSHEDVSHESSTET